MTTLKKRGPKFQEDRPTTIKLRLSTSQLDRWKLYAASQQKSLSELIREAVDEKIAPPE